MAVSERFVITNGVRLHVLEAGPPEGDPVVLLHGFPELSYGWRKQIGPLAEAGYRVIAPDQRGYNLSDKPRGLSAYRLDKLAADIVGLIDEAGHEKATVVGHDWGAAVAWWVAITHPGRVRALAVLNVPHPVVMRRHLLASREQRRRSRYMLFFQLPWLPERRLASDDYRMLAAALERTSRPGTFTDDEVAHYRAAWAQPGALSGMLAWYRAALRRPPQRPASIRVAVPALVIWGAQDRFLGEEMVAPSLALCDCGRAEVIRDATHWVQHEEPERVNALLLEHLRITS